MRFGNLSFSGVAALIGVLGLCVGIEGSYQVRYRGINFADKATGALMLAQPTSAYAVEGFVTLLKDPGVRATDFFIDFDKINGIQGIYLEPPRGDEAVTPCLVLTDSLMLTVRMDLTPRECAGFFFSDGKEGLQIGVAGNSLCLVPAVAAGHAMQLANKTCDVNAYVWKYVLPQAQNASTVNIVEKATVASSSEASGAAAESSSAS